MIFVEIFRKRQKVSSGPWIRTYDRAILEELVKKKAIDLDIRVTIEI